MMCVCVLEGLFVYSCGCVVVLENLHNGSQRHWLGHSEEISTLAVTYDAQVLLHFNLLIKRSTNALSGMTL